MFVAGIEIFFGFVAGAILLVAGLSVVYGGFFIAAAAMKGICRIVAAHPGWILLTAVYCLVLILFAGAGSSTLFGISCVMVVGLMIAVPVAFFKGGKKTGAPVTYPASPQK